MIYIHDMIEKLRKFPQNSIVVMDVPVKVLAQVNPTTKTVKYFNLDDDWPCYSDASIFSSDDDMEDPYRDDGWKIDDNTNED